MREWKRRLFKSWRRRRAARHRRLEHQFRCEAIPYMLPGEVRYIDACKRIEEAEAMANYHRARAQELDR